MPATRRSSGTKPSSAAQTVNHVARRQSPAKKTKTIEDMIPLTCTPYFVPPGPPSIPEASSSSSSSKAGPTDLRRRTLKGKDKATEGERQPLVGLSTDDKDRLLQELMGFHPRTVVEDISEACRKEIYSITSTISNWVDSNGFKKTPEEETDAEQGPYKLETLLESHMDPACDRFIAWCLRNSFHIPDDLRLVLPWHKDLDFDRASYVAALPSGEADVQEKIDDLRAQVVEMRKLKHQLDLANKKLDKQVKGLELEKQAAGFVLEMAEESGLAPLPQAADALENILNTLASKLEPFGDTVPTPRPVQTLPDSNAPPGGTERKIWEQGRAAYLNWAASGGAESGSGSGSSTGGVGEIDKASREKAELDRMKGEVQVVADADELGKLQDVLSAS